MRPPTLKTYEEFITEFEKDTDAAFKREVWKQYEFACKERDRLKDKHKRRRDKLRESIPLDQRKKLGRPRKLPLETPAPVSEFLPK